MINILKRKPVATVEQIHKEFDEAQDKILTEINNLLSENSIITETKLERKGKLLEEIGFVNTELAQSWRLIKEKKVQKELELNLSKEQANNIRNLAFKYPFEKFITVDVLNHICEKYGLIHAPINNYIKDVPEKNLLEIKNAKKLEDYDKCPVEKKLIGLKSDYLLKLFNKKEPIFTVEDLKLINYPHLGSLEDWFFNNNNTWSYVAVRDGLKGKNNGNSGLIGNLYPYDKCETIDKSGLFIAAPKSHFNLKGLDKKSKFGFFNVKVEEVK